MRYFLDSSALAKRFHSERGSAQVDRIFSEQSRTVFVTDLSMVELISVAGIKQRTGALTSEAAATFLRQATVSAWLGDFVILNLDRDDLAMAARLLTKYSAKHSLRTLDALHLASALRHRAASHLDFFVASDRPLAKVAALEGFAVIIPEEA